MRTIRRHASVSLLLAGLWSCSAMAADQPAMDDFYWLSEINKASAVMVVEQAIVPKALGGRIAQAVTQTIAEAEKPGARRSGDYLVVEKSLIAIGGPDVTRIHSGRSRQDIGATIQRLGAREHMLLAFERLNEARAAVLALGARHPNAIVPAYTWGVQAQPISFGHYMLGYAQALSRLSERTRQAYARLNASPLGSAALGTSSFPVNRPRLAELLGFEAVIENSLDAGQISPIDSGAELVSLAEACAVTITTFTADVTAQYAQTKPWLLLAEGPQTGVSSFLPQKRNPSGLVFLRERASMLLGHAHTFLLMAHNVQAGMSDYKPIDPKQGDMPNSVLRETAEVLASFTAVLKTLAFDEKRALDEVNADYSMTTELADILQRDADVPFRVGHHFASDLVNFGRSRNLRPADIGYEDAKRIYAEAAKLFNSDGRLPLSEEQFRRSLTAENMVASSKGLGGPQPAEVARMMTAEQGRVASDRAWLEAARGNLQTAMQKRNGAFAALMRE